MTLQEMQGRQRQRFNGVAVLAGRATAIEAFGQLAGDVGVVPPSSDHRSFDKHSRAVVHLIDDHAVERVLILKDSARVHRGRAVRGRAVGHRWDEKLYT